MGDLISVIFIVLIFAGFAFSTILEPAKAKRWKNESGYIVLRTNKGEVFEHRHIAEQVMGRALYENEVVHHINGRKADNRIKNLCVMDENDHFDYHDWYDWIYDNYGVYPRRETQLKKLKESFRAIILAELNPFLDQSF